MNKINKCIFLIIYLLINTSVYADYADDIMPLSDTQKQQIMNYTWHPGCPISPDDLVQVKINYWGFDQNAHTGILIINQSVAENVVEIFKILYQDKFPIEKIQPLENYQGDEAKAMADNDTFGFHCRPMTSNPALFSIHSYGLAIDINPLINPYVDKNMILPPEGKKYLDRNLNIPGMILKNGIVYNAFEKYGWTWGGDWKYIKDYQHFQKAD